MTEKKRLASLENVEADVLFIELQSRETEPERATAAFGEIYKRYSPRLMQMCQGEAGRMGFTDINLPLLIHDKTMDTIRLKAKPLRLTRLAGKDSRAEKEKVALAYIGQIAKSYILQAARGGHGLYLTEYIDNMIVADQIPDDTGQLTDQYTDERIKLITFALENKLTKMQSDVLITYLNNENPETHRIPEYLRQQLITCWGIKDAHLRKIKERSLNKITTFINKQFKAHKNEESRPKGTRKKAPLRN